MEKLDELLVENLIYPQHDQLEKTIDETVDDLENKIPPQPGIVSKRWSQLSESLKQWESDHPRLTLAVGDVAHALAAAGL